MPGPRYERGCDMVGELLGKGQFQVVMSLSKGKESGELRTRESKIKINHYK